jgi:orotidine-5'-phosphate decarboxylase
MDAQDRLIVAIDESDPVQARQLIDTLSGQVTWFKIGMTLYFRVGPAFVRQLVDDGLNVFLDLKCHDIPHQVEGAVGALAQLGVGLVTVHTGGGPAMLTAAARAADGTATTVLGVTVLTSLDEDQLEVVGMRGEPAALVAQRARVAVECGLGGVVASPLEASAIASLSPTGFEIVTPGIRPVGAAVQDQRRVSTPADAIGAGATRLVVGRPITQAADPVTAAAAVLATIRSST